MSRPTDYDYINNVLRYADNGDTVNPSDRAKVTKWFKNYPILNGKSPQQLVIDQRDAAYLRSTGEERARLDKEMAAKQAADKLELERVAKIREEESQKKFASFYAASTASVNQQKAALEAKANSVMQAGLGTPGMVILALAGLGIAYYYLRGK